MAPQPKSAKKRSLKALSPAAINKMWLEMRREFETTPVGIRELARKYGIKSHTTVLRRHDKEDWRKQPEIIAANLATEGVINTILAAESAPKSAPESTIQAPPENTKDQDSVEIIPNRRTSFEAGSVAVADQSGAVRAGRRMALVQQKQLEKEIASADQIIKFSSEILDMLRVLITEPDLVKAGQIAMKFSAIGGKTESFSGLLRAATAGLEKGVAIRRRALNMEAKSGLGGQRPGQGMDAGDIPEQVRTMLPNLSTEQLLELRRAATIMNKQIQLARPEAEQQTIDGLADAILDGENG